MTHRVKNRRTERISISIFGNKECESKNLEKFSGNLKNSEEKIEITSSCTPLLCLAIQKQYNNVAKKNFNYLKELGLTNS